jgi:hypothetical protein
VSFAYFDSLGNALDPSVEPREIARVDVVMRSVTDRAVTRTGAGAGEAFSDTLLLTIGIRNRR